ncbi:MAG: hemolysin [Verrucomicrobiales bacterium]|nr:hemolysin [Verrucomicrobiales bacterium]
MNIAKLSTPGINIVERVNHTTLALGRPTVAEEESRNAATSENRPPEKEKRPSWKFVLIASVAFAVVFASGTFIHQWWKVGRFIESTDDSYVGGDITAIAAKVSGLVAEVKVADNQTVHRGDLLIKLDDRDYRAALARAESAVTAREAAIVNLNAVLHLQEAIISQSLAEVGAADAEIYRAQQDQIRYKELYESATVSIQTFQKADSEFKQAAAAGEKARANQSAGERKVGVIESQKLEAEAALQQAIAEREIAQLNLSYTEVRAPIDGIVGNRSAKTGSYATTGSQLLSLVPTRGLWIDANYKESQLARIHVGSPARVKLDSQSGKSFYGHVVSVAPATGAQFSVLPPENATGNFTKIVQRVAVRIMLDPEGSEELHPGLSVTAEVDSRSSGKASL